MANSDSMADILASLKRQSDEFDAVVELGKVYQATIATVAVVDDDYPEARSRYEGALHDLIRKLNENGRDTSYGASNEHLETLANARGLTLVAKPVKQNG